MGAIRRKGPSPGPFEYLYQSHTIGRASSCQLVLARRAISGHHATIRWDNEAWTLRDLGSRNGTFLNGRRLTGVPQTLTVGDELTFAENDELWELVDACAPRSLLIPVDAEESPIELDAHDVLALPSADDPLVTIYQHQDLWQIERDGECSPLDDGQSLHVGERQFRVMLVDDSVAATDANSVPVQRRVEDLTMEILVAPHEESASVRAQLGSETHELPERTFFYLLAFLARRRLDHAEPRGPTAGWVDVDTTCRELGLPTPEALGLLVYRCRKAIKACDLEDPASLVDRSRKGWIRIGIEASRLSVTRLDG